MMLRRAAAILMVAIALTFGLDYLPARAAAPQASGGGSIRTAAGAMSIFVVELDEARPLVFVFSDYGTDPPRTVAMESWTRIDCRSEYFGVPTIALSGLGSDTEFPGQSVMLQLYLVDGGGGDQDQVSLKISRLDGLVLKLIGLSPLEAGDLTVSC